MVGTQTWLNNRSYRYLRSVGNHWNFDPKAVHPKVVERLYKRYDDFDVNGDRVLDMDEILMWPEKLKKIMPVSEEQEERLRAALQLFFEGVGVDKEGLKREDWIECVQAFAEAEKTRKKLNDPNLVEILGDAYFDVIDADGSGEVDLEELKIFMQVFEIPEVAAYTFFMVADTDHSGSLNRAEMNELFSKFWLEEYNPKYDGIYAYKY